LTTFNEQFRNDHHDLHNPYDASLADHNRCLRMNPNYAEGYYQRAWTYRWLGDYNLAKADYDKEVSLDSDYANQEAPVVTRTYSGYSPVIRR
jgi:tetratricopeptide (TPR) repeat protein